MSAPSWDGPDLLGALRQATQMLAAHVDEVNALNVFPVPDGDTGSNMLATIQAARDEAETVAPAERTVAHVSAAIALGALMGARGNSGVILSQLFRGISEAIAGKERVDGPILADAFERGCTLAFAAVAHPVEGTILTVARSVAEAARAQINVEPSLESVLVASVAAASDAVERTPEQLPILREAGVVDAGGRGLELLLRGALGYLRDERQPMASSDTSHFTMPSLDALEEDGFGYETVFVVQPTDGLLLDPGSIRQLLDELGESVLVAGDGHAVKIHVHNERPDEVIAYGLSLGVLSRISVENLDRQAGERRRRGDDGSMRDGAPTQTAFSSPLPVSTRSPVGGIPVIAVAQGSGLARLFGELGVVVVAGGQAANPSAGELVAAIRANGGSEVIVLPNNPNVRLAARQAGELLPDVRVSVVPTRNAAEGVAALLAMDANGSATDNVSRMTKAARAIQTLQVTTAVRDARIGRRRVKRGQQIVLDPDDGLLAADGDGAAALIAGLRKLTPGFELLTVYYGDGVDRAAAEATADVLRAEFADVEVELVEGGQPHYSYLVSAE